VSDAGDVNRDGFGDVIIGAPGAGASYVVFGNASGFGANLNLASLDGRNGFKLSATGSDVGWSVSAAGDVNGEKPAINTTAAISARPTNNKTALRFNVRNDIPSFFMIDSSRN